MWQPSWGYYVNEARVLHGGNARAYGRWLGVRYKSAANVVWMMGGDRPAAGFEDVWRELAGGLRDGDGGSHLISYHPCYGRSSASRTSSSTCWKYASLGVAGSLPSQGVSPRTFGVGVLDFSNPVPQCGQAITVCTTVNPFSARLRR